MKCSRNRVFLRDRLLSERRDVCRKVILCFARKNPPTSSSEGAQGSVLPDGAAEGRVALRPAGEQRVSVATLAQCGRGAVGAMDSRTSANSLAPSSCRMRSPSTLARSRIAGF